MEKRTLGIYFLALLVGWSLVFALGVEQTEAESSSPQWAEQGILHLDRSPYAKLRSVPIRAVKMGEGFWAERRRVNVERSIPALYDLLEQHGIVDNFRRLSGRKQVERRGPLYTDSDLYKWMEAVAFVLQSEDRPALRAKFEEMTDEILAAQEPSGYLNTYYVDERKPLRWTEQHRGHELYCLGHWLQAGIAYYRATGDRKLLDGGIRFVNYLIENFGPSKQPALAGHPEIELALVELYRTTGDRRFLDFAGYILQGDGERLTLRPQQIIYMFSGIPFTERKQLEGHAVRALYATSGATDYYLETGDPAYRETLDRLFLDLIRGKMYITGGVGSRAAGEAFGEAFELPNLAAYTESCAAIANLMWNWRMLKASGDARHADILERALYNGINSGMSLDGTLYCYRNPLESRGEKIRNPWYDTTCCPPNLQRTFAALPGYVYSTSDAGVYAHLFHTSTLDWRLADGTGLKLEQRTSYPWEGTVEFKLTPAATKEFSFFVRIPGWTPWARVSVNGAPAKGAPAAGRYFEIRRTWKPGDTVKLELDMSPRLIQANPLVRENVGRVAVERGPLVYAIEQHDQANIPSIFDATLALSSPTAKGFREEFRRDLLGGVLVLKHRAKVAAKPLAELPLYRAFGEAFVREAREAELTFIPYYAWANREPTAMQVWVPYTLETQAARASRGGKGKK